MQLSERTVNLHSVLLRRTRCCCESTSKSPSQVDLSCKLSRSSYWPATSDAVVLIGSVHVVDSDQRRDVVMDYSRADLLFALLRSVSLRGVA